jgi:alpha-glucosidase
VNWSLTSPGGSTAVTLACDHQGRLSYEAICEGVTVIAASRLGITTATGDLTTGLRPVAATPPTLVADGFTLPHGKRRSSRVAMAERAVRFAAPDGMVVEIVLRAADDGVAFRYRSPHAAAPVVVTHEATEFRFPAGGRSWLQQLQPPGHAEPAYEEVFTNGTPLEAPGPHTGWFFPALFEIAGRWALLTEAGADPGYTLSQLAGPVDRAYRIAFPNPGEALGVGSSQPTVAGAWQTPWRVVVLGSMPGTVLESDLVRHLGAPSRIEDTSWIRPGRVAWSWWSDHESPRSIAAQHAYVDFAAEMGWEHVLVDANWNLLPESEIVDLIAHAEARGVGVFLWYNSGGPHNAVSEQPRDRMYEVQVRRSELAKLAAWGVAGIKVDFFHSDKQAAVRLFHDILEDAATHRVMVNFHGCTIPRGWDRTWPHLMTMEGVRGAEQYSFRDTFPAEAPTLNTILPFTRNVPGSMDYTPVTFSDARFPHLTTNAHELALSVVFESALQHLADSAASYRAQPDAVIDYLRRVPAAWDETRWIEGEPGSHVVVARRHEATWFIAGINAAGEARRVTVNLAGLAGRWDLVLIADGGGPRTFEISQRAVTAPVRFAVTMAPHGGFAARLA